MLKKMPPAYNMRLLTEHDIPEMRDLFRLYLLEKPRDFDPFGQTGLSPLATI